jgi:hypothetical protein
MVETVAALHSTETSVRRFAQAELVDFPFCLKDITVREMIEARRGGEKVLCAAGQKHNEN